MQKLLDFSSKKNKEMMFNSNLPEELEIILKTLRKTKQIRY